MKTSLYTMKFCITIVEIEVPLDMCIKIDVHKAHVENLQIPPPPKSH